MENKESSAEGPTEDQIPGYQFNRAGLNAFSEQIFRACLAGFEVDHLHAEFLAAERQHFSGRASS